MIISRGLFKIFENYTMMELPAEDARKLLDVSSRLGYDPIRIDPLVLYLQVLYRLFLRVF
jgi:hypothetical protein